MFWLLVCLAPAVAVVVRLVTLRHRPQIWWLALTISLGAISIASMLLVNEDAVNQALGVANISYLLSCVLYVVAAGAVTMHVHTLRHEQPSRLVLWTLAAATAAACATLVVLWIAAPVHTGGFRRFRDIPLSPTLVAFEWVFHLLFIPVLINVAVCAFGIARRTPDLDPARRVGVTLTAVGVLIDVMAHVLYLVRASAQPAMGTKALLASTAADIVTIAAVFCIGLGATVVLAWPPLVHTIRAYRLARTLRPLWQRVLELHPEVAMRGGWRTRNQPTLRAERMLVEIADALYLVRLPRTADVATDPYPVIARVLRSPTSITTDSDTRPAAAALPTPTSRLEEEAQLLELAQHYAKEPAHAS